MSRYLHVIMTMSRRWRHRARTRRQLRELDGRLLADIGLTGAQCRVECAKWFWRA
jgi:uncharacterized protein YjiS (DUF1127 family)